MEISAQTRKFQKELNAGTSALVLLNVENRSEKPLYGYQIARMLEEHQDNTLMMKQGTLYPVLRSLEENNLLQSTIEPSVSGPPRRYYAITAEGRAALAEWIAIWNKTSAFVNTQLEGKA